MRRPKTHWILAGITSLLFLLAPLTLFVSVEIARSEKDPDRLEVIGFLAALVLLALSVVCGAMTVVSWWNQKDTTTGLSL